MTFKEKLPKTYGEWKERFDPKNPEWIEDFETLKLHKPDHKPIYDRHSSHVKTSSMDTIAHVQAQLGWQTHVDEILMLSNKRKQTVAHEMFKQTLWKDKKIPTFSNNVLKQLSMETPLAIIIARKQIFTNDREILKVRDTICTVAEYQVEKGWTTNDNEILNLSTAYGKRKLKDEIILYNIKNKPHLLTIDQIKEFRAFVNAKHIQYKNKPARILKKIFLKDTI